MEWAVEWKQQKRSACMDERGKTRGDLFVSLLIVGLCLLYHEERKKRKEERERVKVKTRVSKLVPIDMHSGGGLAPILIG